MEIKTYKTRSYKNCPIYFRNWGRHFEYLTVIRNQLYTAHIDVAPHWVTRLLYWLGIEETMFSTQQQGRILKVLSDMAETTIEFILDKREKAKAKKLNKAK